MRILWTYFLGLSLILVLGIGSSLAQKSNKGRPYELEQAFTYYDGLNDQNQTELMSSFKKLAAWDGDKESLSIVLSKAEDAFRSLQNEKVTKKEQEQFQFQLLSWIENIDSETVAELEILTFLGREGTTLAIRLRAASILRERLLGAEEDSAAKTFQVDGLVPHLEEWSLEAKLEYGDRLILAAWADNQLRETQRELSSADVKEILFNDTFTLEQAYTILDVIKLIRVTDADADLSDMEESLYLWVAQKLHSMPTDPNATTFTIDLAKVGAVEGVTPEEAGYFLYILAELEHEWAQETLFEAMSHDDLAEAALKAFWSQAQQWLPEDWPENSSEDSNSSESN